MLKINWPKTDKSSCLQQRSCNGNQTATALFFIKVTVLRKMDETGAIFVARVKIS